MKAILIIASLLGLTAVILGAMGSHALGETLSAEQAGQFAIALRYQQLYSILLVALSLFGLNFFEQNKLIRFSCLALLIGIILFSGSLYLSIFFTMPILKYGTPCGGFLLMLGWLLLLFFGIYYKQDLRKTSRSRQKMF